MPPTAGRRLERRGYAAPTGTPRTVPGVREPLVWYVSYGSNLCAARFDCYLFGGRPAGASRVYSGCRDRTPPRARRAVQVSGALLFAGASTVWQGGGVGFLDPAGSGLVAGRAYLVTLGQFADIVTQEMRRAPGAMNVGPAELAAVTGAGRLVLGPGWYETLIGLGELRGLPAVTFTRDVPPPGAGLALAAPSAQYLSMLAAGLVEAHAMTADEVGAYLAGCPGAAGVWTPERAAGLLPGPVTTGGCESVLGIAREPTR